jgi:hypothetical protein
MVQAADLRLRLEFGGIDRSWAIPQIDSLQISRRLNFEGMTLDLHVPWAQWGDDAVRCEFGRDDTLAWCDLIFYSGPSIPIRLDSLEKAGAAVALHFGSINEMPIPAQALLEDGICLAQWQDLSLSFPVMPSPAQQLSKLVEGKISSRTA